MKNLYKILGVSNTATADEIKKAYRKLAKKYHPDIIGDDKAANEKFQEISMAYQTLENEDKRRKYDEELNNLGNTSSSSSNNTSHTNQRNTKNTAYNPFGNAGDFSSQFESFFGFNPNTNDVSKDKVKKKDNGFNTDAMFESFFKPHK